MEEKESIPTTPAAQEHVGGGGIAGDLHDEIEKGRGGEGRGEVGWGSDYNCNPTARIRSPFRPPEQMYLEKWRK